jgi:hypothetical protein
MMFSTADRCTVRVGSPQDFLRPLSCGYVAVRGAFPRATSRETRADHRGSGYLDGHPRCFARTGTVAGDAGLAHVPVVVARDKPAWGGYSWQCNSPTLARYISCGSPFRLAEAFWKPSAMRFPSAIWHRKEPGTRRCDGLRRSLL